MLNFGPFLKEQVEILRVFYISGIQSSNFDRSRGKQFEVSYIWFGLDDFFFIRLHLHKCMTPMSVKNLPYLHTKILMGRMT